MIQAVVAKTDVNAGSKGMSLVLVESGLEGFSKGKNLEKLGDEFSRVNFKKMAFAYVKNAISWSN